MTVCQVSSHIHKEKVFYMSKICFINESLPFLLVVPILSEKKERSVFFDPIAMLSTKCPLPLL